MTEKYLIETEFLWKTNKNFVLSCKKILKIYLQSSSMIVYQC